MYSKYEARAEAPKAESAGGSTPGIDADTFRRILSSFPSGVTVVTCADPQNRPIGLTATAVASVSLRPPQLLVCLQQDKYTLRKISETLFFAVNFLSGRQAALSEHFACPPAHKFAHVSWKRGPATGAPLLAGTLAHAECAVENIVPAGDHAVVIGGIVDGDAKEGLPLLYHARRYASSPEAGAPT